MLQVESCIELYCYAGCILSSKQMPCGTTRSPPGQRCPPENPSQTGEPPRAAPRARKCPRQTTAIMVYPVISFSCPPNKLD